MRESGLLAWSAVPGSPSSVGYAATFSRWEKGILSLNIKVL
jgi:hypothetical protein